MVEAFAVQDYRERMRACAEAIGLDPPAIVLPADHFVELNGIRFHYLDWGNPHLPHVLLFHGGGLTAHTYDMAALVLRDRYHLVALDSRGHGDTDWTPDDQIEGDFGNVGLEDTTQFVDHLGYDRVSLVAMGGVSALQYAVRHPERVDALALVDAGPEPKPQGQASTMAFHAETDVLERFEDFLDRAIAFNPMRKREHLVYSLAHSLKRTDRGWMWKQDPRGRDRVRAMPLEERQAGAERRNEALWEDIGALRTRTLVVRGDQSKTLAADVAQRMVEAMADGALVTVADATGYVPGDRPHEFAEALDAFLSRR